MNDVKEYVKYMATIWCTHGTLMDVVWILGQE